MKALDNEIIQLLVNKQKIQAVKKTRELYKLGLKEAKDYLELHEEDIRNGKIPEAPSPDFRKPVSERDQQKPGGIPALVWIALLVLIAIIIWMKFS